MLKWEPSLIKRLLMIYFKPPYSLHFPPDILADDFSIFSPLFQLQADAFGPLPVAFFMRPARIKWFCCRSAARWQGCWLHISVAALSKVHARCWLLLTACSRLENLIRHFPTPSTTDKFPWNWETKLLQFPVVLCSTISSKHSLWNAWLGFRARNNEQCPARGNCLDAFVFYTALWN